jgi:hypothetical protein
MIHAKQVSGLKQMCFSLRSGFHCEDTARGEGPPTVFKAQNAHL